MASDGQPLERHANVDGSTLGARLRAARQRKHLTLRTVADRSGLSRGFINQVELGQVSPSFASLSKIADALGESLVELFQPPTSRREGLVRASERVRMTLPEGGYLDEILTPSLEGKLLVLRSTILPGADSGPAYHHDADEECAAIVRRGGRMAAPCRTLGQVARFGFVKDPDGNWIEMSARASLTGIVPRPD